MTANFVQISSLDELEALMSTSVDRPVLLVKHSNRCGISSNVMYDLKSIAADVNFIVVQESRELSDAIARRLGQSHQSPQAFVLKNGNVIYHATHYGIDPAKILEAMETQ